MRTLGKLVFATAAALVITAPVANASPLDAVTGPVTSSGPLGLVTNTALPLLGLGVAGV
ncbi:hypothetical protein [Actinosynnema sp. NPDC023587]|uniref:hypothetical protein n=1 Tax=Actinosynnema sp. NPDC023587 TaxID=3154695 RepID=UPI003407D0B1